MPRFKKNTTATSLFTNIEKYPVKKRNSKIIKTVMEILKKEGNLELRFFRSRYVKYIQDAFSQDTNIEIAYASTIKAIQESHTSMNYGTFSIRLVKKES